MARARAPAARSSRHGAGFPASRHTPWGFTVWGGGGGTVNQDPVLTYLGTFMKECSKSCGKWLKIVTILRHLQHRFCFKSSTCKKYSFQSFTEQRHLAEKL
jgi:hypothetical protein